MAPYLPRLLPYMFDSLTDTKVKEAKSYNIHQPSPY
jgi:hypothetical protein